MMWAEILAVVLMTIGHTFVMFAITWDYHERRKEANREIKNVHVES